ncbi:MAG: hypothetical protein SGJ02_09940, partial [bacterium]|nr:hypothetical protein [bacterium]
MRKVDLDSLIKTVHRRRQIRFYLKIFIVLFFVTGAAFLVGLLLSNISFLLAGLCFALVVIVLVYFYTKQGLFEVPLKSESCTKID